MVLGSACKDNSIFQSTLSCHLECLRDIGYIAGDGQRQIGAQTKATRVRRCVRRRTDAEFQALKNGNVIQVHMTYTSATSPILKAIHMTFETQKSTSPAVPTLKPEQHHTKAAEHLELAAKSHKEVAKCIGANDHAAAQAHSKTAHEHMTQAHEHAEAAKKSTLASK